MFTYKTCWKGDNLSRYCAKFNRTLFPTTSFVNARLFLHTDLHSLAGPCPKGQKLLQINVHSMLMLRQGENGRREKREREKERERERERYCNNFLQTKIIMITSRAIWWKSVLGKIQFKTFDHNWLMLAILPLPHHSAHKEEGRICLQWHHLESVERPWDFFPTTGHICSEIPIESASRVRGFLEIKPCL